MNILGIVNLREPDKLWTIYTFKANTGVTVRELSDRFGGPRGYSWDWDFIESIELASAYLVAAPIELLDDADRICRFMGCESMSAMEIDEIYGITTPDEKKLRLASEQETRGYHILYSSSRSHNRLAKLLVSIPQVIARLKSASIPTFDFFLVNGEAVELCKRLTKCLGRPVFRLGWDVHPSLDR